jgi:hypothetical protein
MNWRCRQASHSNFGWLFLGGMVSSKPNTTDNQNKHFHYETAHLLRIDSALGFCDAGG